MPETPHAPPMADAKVNIPDDDLIALLDDEHEAPPALAAGSTWEVLIVDDDADVHRATEMALRDIHIEGRALKLIHAYSRQEALALVAQHEDLAVILLDVVMESDDAGLQMVGDVRQRLKREAVRIILRTGQPGYAPELDTIRHYDINDYRTKSELTRVRLFTSLTVAVRVYRQMRAHEQTRRGLEMVVRASTDLSKLHGMHLFAQGVVSQLCALLGIQPEGLICAQAGLQGHGEPARVIAAARKKKSEDEARNRAEELIAQRKWPCYFFDSDTTGEKDFEEFFTDKEVLDMERFESLGVIKNDPAYNGAELDNFLRVISELKQAGIWEKADLVDLFNRMIPDFNHKETGKYLDGRM